MAARIYRPAKSAMQSGHARSRRWVLEHEPLAPATVDPLTGWTGSSDMAASQIRLTFASREEAVAYAERHVIAYRLAEHRPRRIAPKSYADNFRWRPPAAGPSP